ncbi:hypothetical protein HQ619_13025 [Burkholderia gladioli]|uniref:hypothetical protein n=1 Tax=Burkholderia gladioli TaxID=28095 RepID=UPI001560754B|nr:hypothetical protein [Burkholderia gladioli]NRF84860.1 hypothetical protein [Burkholderia gladioli]
MNPKAQPCPRQDSRQAKDAQAACFRKKTWPTSSFPRDGFTGLRPDAGKDNRQRQGKNALAASRRPSWLKRGVEAPSQGRRRVGEPSFVTYRRRTVSVEDGTLWHNLPQQAGA